MTHDPLLGVVQPPRGLIVHQCDVEVPHGPHVHVAPLSTRLPPETVFCQGVPDPSETVNHPQHYGGADNPYEAIKVIEAWKLDFCLGNAVKYISRAGKKDPAKELEDLKKARWYVDRRIQQLEGDV